MLSEAIFSYGSIYYVIKKVKKVLWRIGKTIQVLQVKQANNYIDMVSLKNIVWGFL